MKIFPGFLLLLPLLAACARTVPVQSSDPGSVPAPPTEVDCELISLENEDADTARATFRVTNHTSSAIVFHGYSAADPLYQQEVLVDGTWESSMLGWCGTGASEHTLEPGASLELRVFVLRDDRSYRFRFGRPGVVTPPVSAAQAGSKN